MEENKKEKPAVDNAVEKIKIKKPKKKKFAPDNEITKLDLSKKTEEIDNIIKVDLKEPKDETKENNTDNDGVVAVAENADAPQEQEEVQPEAEAQEAPALEEITNEQVEEVVEEAIAEAEATGKPLPENIQNLVSFMEETGGDLNDYVKLNKNYDDYDNQDLLVEYYKQTKPHLDNEEINFLMEDQFSYDEDVDEVRDIKRKKLALKEQVASAKSHLDGQKSKYYEEIKMGSKLTSEQQKAINFFDRYNKEEADRSKLLEKNTSTFLNKTNQVFNDKFKGFEYNVGDKKYRFNVKDTNKVKETQSDINNFVKKFLNENKTMEDAAGYHKSLYTAMNADTIATHFYEQGKADAMKNSVANAKNINMNPRGSHGEASSTGGLQYKVLGENSADFKFKIKNKNK